MKWWKNMLQKLLGILWTEFWNNGNLKNIYKADWLISKGVSHYFEIMVE